MVLLNLFMPDQIYGSQTQAADLFSHHPDSQWWNSPFFPGDQMSHIKVNRSGLWVSFSWTLHEKRSALAATAKPREAPEVTIKQCGLVARE